MFKKMFSGVIVSLSLLLSGIVFLLPNLSEENNVCKTSLAETIDVNFSVGDGSHDKPYAIYNSTDLIRLSYLVNTGAKNSKGERYSTLSYELMYSIGLSESYWTPIGTEMNPFEGTFDGNYNTVANIKLNSNSLTGATSVGFFGNIKGALIHRLIVGGKFENYDTSSVSLPAGVIVGKIEDSEDISYIIDCYDETERFNLPTMNDEILSIGFDENSKGAVFRGDGCGSFCTLEDVDNSIRLTLNGEVQSYLNEGYVQRYYTSSENLYKAVERGSCLVEEKLTTNVVMSLVGKDYSDYMNTPCNCYIGVKPLASVYEVTTAGQYYYREVGFAGCWVRESGAYMTFGISKSAQDPLAITFDFGYITSIIDRNYTSDTQGTDETIKFKYAQSLTEWVSQQYEEKGKLPFAIEKLGYDFQGFSVKGVNIFEPVGNNDAYIAVKLEGESSYTNCFAGVDSEFDLDFEDIGNEITTNIYFAMESGENEEFFTNEKMGDVIQKYSYSEEDINNFQETLNDCIGIQTSGVGHYFTYTVSLKDGYVIKTEANEGCLSINNNISDVDSGVYYYFENTTGLETRHGGYGYREIRANSDNYDPSFASVSRIAGSNVYEITAYVNANPDATPGDIYIIIERETFEVELTPSLSGGDVDYTWEVESGYGASIAKKKVTIDGEEKDIDLLTCRYEDTPVLKLTIGDKNQTIKGIEGNLIPVIGEFGFDVNKIDSLQFGEITIDQENNATIISGIVIDGFYDDLYDDESYITPPTYTQLRDYLKNSTNSKHQHNFIEFTIGYTVTIVGVTNNLPEGTTGNRLKHIGININTQTTTYISATGIKVDIVLTDILTITNNGYYEVEKIIVHTHYDENYQPITYSQTFEASSIIGGSLSLGSIFTLPYDEDKGILDDYYTIEVIYKELVYDVIYKFTFNGEELEDWTNLSDILRTYSVNQTNIKPDVVGTNNIQLSELGTKIVKLSNTEISFSSENKDGFAKGNWALGEEVINSGSNQSISWTMGTGDITVTFNFIFKKIEIHSENDAWLYHNSTYASERDVFEKELIYTFAFRYNFESQAVESDLTKSGWTESPKLKNTYWMNTADDRPWYDKNLASTARVDQGEYALQIIESYLGEQPEGTVVDQIYIYEDAFPVIEYRTVNVKYTLGNVDGGKFYDSDKQTALSSTHSTEAVVIRGTALPTALYYNAAHNFLKWNSESNIGANTVSFEGNIFEMPDNSWNALFETNTYYVPNNSSIKSKDVTLVAQWNKTAYKLTVDGIETNVEIKLADQITATLDGERDGQAEIQINGGERIYSGFSYGYVGVGFKLKYGSASYSTSAQLQLADLVESEYFDTERLSIDILRNAAIYRYYLAKQHDGNGHDYFYYDWTDEDLVDGNSDSILDTNGLIGKDGDLYFLNVSYNSDIYNVVNEIKNLTGQTLSFIRPGYVGYLNDYSIAGTNNVQTIQTYAWNLDFERNASNYNIDYAIVPALWVKTSYPETISTSVLSNAYYGNYGNVATASFKYNGTTVALAVDAILDNGDKISKFGFVVTTPSGEKATYEGITALDVLCVKGIAGAYKIDFFVEFIDTVDIYSYDKNEGKPTFETKKYSISTGDKTLQTHYQSKDEVGYWIGSGMTVSFSGYYTGNSQFVDDGNTRLGTFTFGRDLDGGLTNTVYISLTNAFESYEIVGDNTVGEKRTLVGKANPEYIYQGFTFEEIYGEDTFEFTNRLTIVQTPIEIELIGSSYFVKDTTLEVMKDVESTFTIAGNTFTYFIDSLSIELNDQLTQREFGAGDENKFVCQGFKVLNSNGEDVTSNFVWKFSDTSNYILEEVEEIQKIEAFYDAMWLVTDPDGNLSDLQSTDSASITISSITMNGRTLTKTTQGQTIFKNGNDDVVVVSQNGKPKITVTILKSALSGELKFTLIVNEKATSYAYLGTGTSLLGEAYKDKFTADTFGQDSLEMSFTFESETADGPTYIVFTNTDGGVSEKKIIIDIDEDVVLLSNGASIEVGSFVNDGESVLNAESFEQEYWIYNSNILNTWESPSRKGYQALGWAIFNGTEYVELDVVTINNLLNAAQDEDTITVYPIWQILQFNVTFASAKLDTAISKQVDYFDSISQDIVLKEGFKVKEVSYSNGSAVSGTDDSSLIGQRRVTWVCDHILNSVTISFVAEDINVKFVVKNNPPSYVLQEVKEEEEDFTYSSLTTSTSALLPTFAYDGAYTMSGYGYKQGESITKIEETSLRSIVDIFDSDVNEDIEIELYALWTPVNYTIIFNVGSGENLVGNKTESATFGKAITNLSSATKDGFVFAGWLDANGKSYTNVGDILTTIGQYSNTNSRWEINLSSNWVSGEFKITISADSHVQLTDEDGNTIANGSEYLITFGNENAKKIKYTVDAGYSLITPTLTKGSIIVEGNIISISNLIENQSITISSSANENTISLNLSNIEKVWVNNVVFNGSSFAGFTGEDFIIKVQAVDGYEFGASFAPTISNGEAKNIANAVNTYEFTLTGFTQEVNITISAYAGENTITIIDQSSAVDKFEIDGNEILSGNSFKAYTDTEVVLKVWLKYGYFNLVQDSSYTTLSVGTKEYDGRFYYEVEISGFTDDITLNFTAEKREFSFSVVSTDESQGTIVCDQEQTVKYGENVTLNYALDPDYLFVAWKDKNGNIISETEGEISLTVDENNFKKDLLEAGEDYQIFAHFVIGRKDLSFDIKGKGSILLKQETKSINKYISAGETTVATFVEKVYINHDVVITIVADMGYEIDKLAVGLIEINPAENFENEEFVFNAKNKTITMNVSRFGTSQFTIYFKPSAVNVYVVAGASVNGIEILGTTEGGSVFLADSEGNIYESGHDVYKEYNGKNVAGAQYSIEGFADEDRYFVIITNEGFKAVINTIGVCSYSTVKVGGAQLHYLSGIRTDVDLKVVFVAQPRDVEFNFLVEGSAYTNIYAGKFTARTSDRLVYAYNNNSPSVTVTAIHGKSITVDIYTSLSFYFDRDRSQGLQFSIVNVGQEGAGIGIKNITISSISDANYIKTGFREKATITIDKVTTDAIIYIYVTPIEYNINFIDTHSGNVISLDECVVYGENINLSGLSTDDQLNFVPIWDKHTFIGYYTKDIAGSGSIQYIDPLGRASNIWREHGYKFNGDTFEAEHNFDPQTNTFTLYSIFILNKAKIRVNFVPGEILVGKDDKLTISTVITNLSEMAAWITQGQPWYTEVSEGSTLMLKALKFDNYQFAGWAVTRNEESPVIYSTEEITISDIKQGNYLIVATYNPKIELSILNVNTGKAEGGLSLAYQEGQPLTNYYAVGKDLTVVATAGEGFRFLYWIVENTGDFIYGDEVNGVFTYTFTQNLVEPLKLTAVFKGRDVSLRIYYAELEKYHDLNALYVNGEETIFKGLLTINVAVGDELKFELAKKNGYTFAVNGISTDVTQDSTTGLYYATGQIKIADLTDNGNGTYNLYIDFTIEREMISFEFNLLLKNPADEFELSKAGYLMHVDKDGRQTFVDGQTFTSLYADENRLLIYPSDKYRIKSAIVYLGRRSYDITSLVKQGVLIIDKEFEDIYFSLNIVIEVEVERMVWNTSEFSSPYFGKGDGSRKNPYIIATAQDLALLSYLVNNGVQINGIPYSYLSYKVVNDIDLSGKFWDPIGTEEHCFNGYIYLGVHTFKNVSHYVNYEDPAALYFGLFRYLGEDAEVVIVDVFTRNAIIVGICVGTAILTIVIIFLIIKRRKKKKLHTYATTN